MIDQSGFKMACNSLGDRARIQICRRSAFGTPTLRSRSTFASAHRSSRPAQSEMPSLRPITIRLSATSPGKAARPIRFRTCARRRWSVGSGRKARSSNTTWKSFSTRRRPRSRSTARSSQSAIHNPPTDPRAKAAVRHARRPAVKACHGASSRTRGRAKSCGVSSHRF